MSDIIDNNIISLYKEKKWKEIVESYNGENKLSWIIPSEANIKFIETVLLENNLTGIISVGCGSGLLEWIVKESLGINIIGIEVDGCWWKCKYAPPTFIPLHLAQFTLKDDESTKSILSNSSFALMFCYFNNWDAFIEYENWFLGSILIIIGPGCGRYTHTDPAPFDMKLSNKWTMLGSQEVRNTKDYIALYKKK